MNSDLEKTLLTSPDSLVKYYLGIPDFNQRLKSYAKILYSHCILPYDNDSIYFIDKLHLTYTSTKNISKGLIKMFYLRESIVIDEYLTLKPNYGNGNNYHQSFLIEFDGEHFGYLHIGNTKRTNINKIELDNRLLYQRPIIYILSRMYHLAVFFKMCFNNINVIEIARDTVSPLYSMITEIYYQSTKCNCVVHKIAEKEPIYKPVTKAKMHDYPDENGTSGTFTIGVRKSESIVRVYNKTTKITTNDFKKSYVDELHKKHFGRDKNICRVEVSIHTNAFGKSGIFRKNDITILDALNPNYYLAMFFKAFGNKMTFKILNTKYWDYRNNDKYEEIRIIPQPNLNKFNKRKLLLSSTAIRFKNNNHIKKCKFKLTEYFDQEIPFRELKRYLKAQLQKNALTIEELQQSHEILLRNYKKPIDEVRMKRLRKLILSLKRVLRKELQSGKVYQILAKIPLIRVLTDQVQRT